MSHHLQYPGEVMLELPSWEEGLGILWLIFLRYTPVVYNKLITLKYTYPWEWKMEIAIPLSVAVLILSRE